MVLAQDPIYNNRRRGTGTAMPMDVHTEARISKAYTPTAFMDAELEGIRAVAKRSTIRCYRGHPLTFRRPCHQRVTHSLGNDHGVIVDEVRRPRFLISAIAFYVNILHTGLIPFHG